MRWTHMSDIVGVMTAKLHVFVRFDSTPVIGEYVTATSTIYSGRRVRTSQCGGVYLGVKPSEHNGDMMHMFRDGFIGDIPQAHHGFPVSQVRP